VCDFCYDLILAEYRLIEAEKKMAKRLAILPITNNNSDEVLIVNACKNAPFQIKNEEYLSMR
jgi:hypothetical protein